jgi:tetratricopeptide (TPR) repeat protein
MGALAWKEGPASVPWAEGFWAAVMARDSTAAFAFLDSIADRAQRMGVMSGTEYREPGRALAWLWMGRPERARVEIERGAGRAAPGSITAGYWTAARVGLLGAQGRPAEALGLLPRARWLGFTIMSSELRLQRARLLARCGRHAEALATLDSLARCPAIYPDEAVRLHLERGHSLEALGRPAEAAAAYREFLRIWKDADPGRPETAEARRALARLASPSRTPTPGRR